MIWTPKMSHQPPWLHSQPLLMARRRQSEPRYCTAACFHRFIFRVQGQSSHQHFILARVVCDFGNMIVGTQKKKTFKITNTGGVPVTFDLRKSALQGSPFTIEVG